MKKNQAIEILSNQKEKLKPLKHDERSAWIANISAYIKTFFGENSQQYNYIKNYVFFTTIFIEPHSPSQLQTWTDQAKPELYFFLDECIEYIKNNGIKKKEWNHFLVTKHPSLIWSIFTACLLFAFFIGKCAANKSNNASGNVPEQKNDSIHKKILFYDSLKKPS